MKDLQQTLGYSFENTALLENALTHSSCANESRGRLNSNERLEFLGDSILGMVVADYLYRTHPDLPEGELTRTRASLVCEESLVEVAKLWNLGAYLRLGRGEESGGGRTRPSIQADAVEAVLAAVYLDGGIAAARKIIQHFILSREAAVVHAGERAGVEILPHRRGGTRPRQALFCHRGAERQAGRLRSGTQQKAGRADGG